MLIPPRCFTCGNPIGHKWEMYKQFCKESTCTEKTSECYALDKLQIHNICCRSMFLTHVDIIDTLLLYKNNPQEEHSFREYIETKGIKPEPTTIPGKNVVQHLKAKESDDESDDDQSDDNDDEDATNEYEYEIDCEVSNDDYTDIEESEQESD